MLAIVSILGGIRIQIRYFIKRIQNTSAYTYQYLYCKCPSDKKNRDFVGAYQKCSMSPTGVVNRHTIQYN